MEYDHAYEKLQSDLAHLNARYDAEKKEIEDTTAPIDHRAIMRLSKHYGSLRTARLQEYDALLHARLRSLKSRHMR